MGAPVYDHLLLKEEKLVGPVRVLQVSFQPLIEAVSYCLLLSWFLALLQSTVGELGGRTRESTTHFRHMEPSPESSMHQRGAVVRQRCDGRKKRRERRRENTLKKIAF